MIPGKSSNYDINNNNYNNGNCEKMKIVPFEECNSSPLPFPASCPGKSVVSVGAEYRRVVEFWGCVVSLFCLGGAWLELSAATWLAFWGCCGFWLGLLPPLKQQQKKKATMGPAIQP